MNVEKFVEVLGADFFTGVPDSQLKALCDYLMYVYGIDGTHHIIAANEGNCTAIAAGYHLATGKIPVVYLQNSGEGNLINPVASLLNDRVYGIPCIFVVGWRGEPGTYDEPQHVYQGTVTLRLLEDMDIATCVVGKDMSVETLRKQMILYQGLLAKGKQVAFVIRKGSLTFDGTVKYNNDNTMLREDIIRHITSVSDRDIIISTTGKASRELFELRETGGQTHGYDFLTVGSMGHSSSIALGIALHKPEKKIWIIDGDGAMLMHMGSMAVMGASSPPNVVHLIINNGAHETVGGQPTVAGKLDLVRIAKGCGYPNAVRVENFESLDRALWEAKRAQELWLIEAMCGIGARADLGRPTTSAKENKEIFMKFLSQ